MSLGSLLLLALTAGQCGSEIDSRPVANAGPDQSVALGDPVHLNGGASYDTDGDALAFDWFFESIPVGSAAALSEMDTSTPRFVADVAGVYVVTLTVSDGTSEASDGVRITAADETIENTSPSLSTIEDQVAWPGQSFAVGFTIRDENPGAVTVVASSSDATLIADADLEVSGSGADRSLRITPAPMGAGSAVITLVARDEGALEGTASFTVDVRRPFGAESAKLIASDGAALDSFARSVSISGDYAVIGAFGDDDHGEDSGSAYIFQRSADGWVQSVKLPPQPPVVAPTATELSAGDRFGFSVAIDGEYVIIGAVLDDEKGTDAGAAYVYARCSSVRCQAPWSEVAKLTASDAAGGDFFGSSVAISGSYAIIGAVGDDHAGPYSGSAYVFRLGSSGWIQIEKVSANDAVSFEQFGASVAIDGDHAIVGAPSGTRYSSSPASAYLFERSGDNWNQVRKLTPDDASEDRFGHSVDVDGIHAIVGVLRTDSAAGTAYMFQRGSEGWQQRSTLTADDASAAQRFGISVSISGKHVVIGASRDDEFGDDAGAAYVFQLGSDGWEQANKLAASDAADEDRFGISVALDGDYAVIGAYLDDLTGMDEGSAYVFLK